jgi:integrase/recombinase XerC/integrase/recombinase XerD
MVKTQVDQGTINTLEQENHIETQAAGFLLDREIQNLSPGTLHFYRLKLSLFLQFCGTQAITGCSQVEPAAVRAFLAWLKENGHNPGGIHACYRALKTFLRWWALENDVSDWKDPFKKVKPPKVEEEPLEPVELDQVTRLLAVCSKDEFTGARDRAILLTLLDTGMRAAELLALDLGDLDLQKGALLIRSGKGGKPRTAFVSQDTRRALRAYVKMAGDLAGALFVTVEGERMSYWALRDMLTRRSRQAGVETPTAHDFRRAFAINSLRAGMDVMTLQRLMGHADLQVLRRYLKQVDQDLQTAHSKYSPVDQLKKGR